ncbi:MAG: carboxypeptidase regulatory-like domain-containing protein, partial [Acidobacteria bacterium]|nr:carboxypeptidase regulatory-like domain-containing protein [Acidobacteriota bacterium]
MEVQNPVSQFERKVTTDASGAFSVANVPFAPYHLTVSQPGFAVYVQDVNLNSPVPVSLKITLQLAATTQEVT